MGPVQLREAALGAYARIEAALPAGAHPGFGAWLRDHHDQIVHRIHGGAHRIDMRMHDSARHDRD
jgi:hypothetical protein